MLSESRAAFRVLVVDDEPLSSRIMSHLLHALGAEHIVVAGGYASAIAELNKDPSLKLVVSDHYMPDGNGIRLLGDVRQGRLPISHDAYFIIATSSQSFALSAIAMMLDVDSFMSKPFSKDELAVRLYGFLTDKTRAIKPADHYLSVDVDGLQQTANIRDPKNPNRPVVPLVPLARVAPGYIISQDLIDKAGGVLLKAGTVLSAHIIARIKELGVEAVPIAPVKK